MSAQGTQKLKLGRMPFSDAGKGSGTRAVGTSFLRSARKDPNTVRSSELPSPGSDAHGPDIHKQHSLASDVSSPGQQSAAAACVADGGVCAQ